MDIEKEEQLKKEQAEIEQKMQQTRDKIKEMAREGELPTPRAMTRGERRRFSNSGVNMRIMDFAKNTKNLSCTQEEMCDWILDNIFPDFDFDELPNNVCRIFAAYILELTYKDELAEKN